MPDLYCEVCKKKTPHKSIMRRSREENSISFTTRFVRLIAQIFTGKNHYQLEQQHFCRYCNCQTIVIEQQMVLDGEEPLMVERKPGQVGAH